jgi:MFS family permease
VKVAQTLVALLGVGTLLVVFSASPWIAIAGFALIGCGTSAMFPLAMSAAAQRTDRPAAVNVAALAQLSFVAFLVGPPCLGFVAEHWGARYSFAACLPFILLSAVFVRALRPAAPSI